MKKRITAILCAGILSSATSQAETFTVPDSQWNDIQPYLIDKEAKVTKGVGFYRIEAPFSLMTTLTNQGFSVENDPVLFRPGKIEMSTFSKGLVSSASTSDPLLGNQTAYLSEIGGYEQANKKWGSDKIKQPTVVIMDSGSLPSDDISFKGGYSYTTVFDMTPTEDYRDRSVSDNGDVCYSGHGLAMAGIIGSKRNNGVGIAGIADSDLYMARVVATDCATGEDVGFLSDLVGALESLTTGNSPVGISSPDIDVVNISLAAESPCTLNLQEAINNLVEDGVTVVASSGNQGEFSTAYAPANCDNVIGVAAHDERGNVTGFSNTGPSVDVMSNGFWYTEIDSDIYGVSSGTSGAAASVSGSIAFLRSLYGDEISPSEVEKILKSSSRPHVSVSECEGLCGDGIQDLYLATNMAESVIEPTVSYGGSANDNEDLIDIALNHALDDEEDCLVDARIDAFNDDRSMCNAFSLSVIAPNIDDDTFYKVVLQRKPDYISSWDDETTESVREINPEYQNMEMLFSYDSSYDYRFAYCAETGFDKDEDGLNDEVCEFPINIPGATFIEKKPNSCQ